MGTKNLLILVLFAASIFISGCQVQQEPQPAEANTPVRFVAADTLVESRDGNLTFSTEMPNLVCEYYSEALPPNLLDRLAQAIDFSFKNGSHREIGYKDLNHAHVLANLDSSDNSLNNFRGILLHTQELIVYSPKAHKKRNVFIDNAGFASIVPCERNEDKLGAINGLCTVYPEDLSLREIVQINFVKVSGVSPDRLRGYEQNVRVIRGEKILFGAGRYVWLN